MSNWSESIFAYWLAGGPLLFPIAIVSFAIWGYFARSRANLTGMLRDGKQIEEAWNQAQATGGLHTLQAQLLPFSGPLACVLRTTLEDIRLGASPRAAFTAREDELLQQVRHDFVLLAALTAVAPLLGLLGTVVGMIHTFNAVAAVAGDTGSRVAGGISQALITTQFGLIVALPGVFGLAALQRRSRHLQVLVAECRTHALLRIANSRTRRL